MCTRYIAPEVAEIERAWHIGRHHPPRWWNAPGTDAFASPVGPFIRAGGELHVGRFGLIPPWSDSATPKMHTYNARTESIAGKPSFKDAWRLGQRCIVPARSFDEPCWETGRNVWWRFRRRDDEPWGLAGLWNTWIDRATGEVHESFTLLTVNADAHPLLRRMHKPDPKLPPHAQDKRSTVSIERRDADQWLQGSASDASALLQPPTIDMIDAAPLSVPAIHDLFG